MWFGLPYRLLRGLLKYTASYIIYKENGITRALNARTGHVDFASGDAASVIQFAIDALGTAGGKIFIKRGTYFLSDTLTLRIRTHLIGEGFATVLKLEDGVNKTMIDTELKTNDRIVLSDLQLDGNKANNTAGHGIRLRGGWRCILERLYIKNVVERALYLDGNATFTGRMNVIRELEIKDPGAQGIVQTWNYDNSFLSCFIEGAGDYGMSLYSGASRLYDLHVYNSAKAGIQITGADRCLLAGCTPETNQRHGIYLYDSEGNRVIGCYPFNNSQEAAGSYDGICLAGASIDNVVEGNRCLDLQPTKTQAYGIDEEGTSDYNLIHGNNCRGNLIGGIRTIGVNTLSPDNIT